MVLGVDPQKMAEMQKVSKHIVARIEIDYKERTMLIGMSSIVPEASALIPQLLEQLANTLGQQLNSFFAVTGKIIEINKGK